MTGYGRFEDNIKDYKILIEIKSVNHRYFEFSPKIPKDLLFLEFKLKSLINSYITRGKIDFYIKIEYLKKQNEVSINNEVVVNYINCLRRLEKNLKLKDNLTLSDVINLPKIFILEEKELDKNLIEDVIYSSTKFALENHKLMREIEGQKIKEDILNKVSYIQENIEKINNLTNETVNIFQQKLYDKLSEILKEKDINDNRILTEVGIISEKIANDEEVVRLQSHIYQLEQILMLDESIGRKLDFLIQEINREINTIASKSQNIDISKIVIELKTTVEKIREQIQNIE